MPGNLTVFVDETGNMTGLRSSLTEALKLPERERVSHIEPVNRVLRWLFHGIRSRVEDTSAIAGFTRKWPVTWQANIFDGPTLGPFHTRQEAIDAEVAHINKTFETGFESNVNGTVAT
jgi:hypothetical protein